MNEQITIPVKNPKSSKRRVFVLVGIFFVLLVGVIGWNFWRRYKSTDSSISLASIFPQKLKETPKAEEPLTGEKVDQDKAAKTPIAVIVENHTEARPHTGLDKASIVYEAIAEGGITRFLALYGPNEPEKVGPVRSARTYFVDWAREYKAPLAHVGGNIDALDLIKQVGARDLDQFRYGLKAYWREPQAGKAVEHTMYGSLSKLRSLARQSDWDDGASYEKMKFKDDASKEARPAAQTITVDFGSPDYQTKWIYRPETNDYGRTISGVNYVAKNLIIQEVKRTQVTSRNGANRYDFTLTGTGKAKIVRDGAVVEAVWKKSGAEKRTKFFDQNDREVELNRGVTWYEIVHPELSVKVE